MTDKRDPRQDVANGGNPDQLFTRTGIPQLPEDDQGGDPVDAPPGFSPSATVLIKMIPARQSPSLVILSFTELTQVNSLQ